MTFIIHMKKWKVKPYMEKDRCQLHTAEHRSSVILYISFWYCSVKITELPGL
ncbi:hypothetical protein HMPREF1547_03306 [Blautia sp. KLE 1732]|nr:hypothetical protein HMPREF1547_03306 [Blautia sp. KLE 1732]